MPLEQKHWPFALEYQSINDDRRYFYGMILFLSNVARSPADSGRHLDEPVIIDLTILRAVLARCLSRLRVGYLTSPLHTYRSQTVMRRITLFSSCLCRNGCANNHYS